MKLNSIRHKLVLAISLFITVILLVIAVGIYIYFRNSTKNLISNQQFSQISSIAGNLDTSIATAHTVLMKGASAMPPHVLTDPDAAQRWLENRPGIKSIFLGGVFLFMPDGKLLVEVPELPCRRGKDFSFRDYYKKTVATGKPQISNPFASSRDGHPTIMMTAPVFDANEQLIFILGGAMDLLSENNVFHSLITQKVGKNGYFYLFAHDRTMVMHPDLSRIMKQDVKPGANKMFDRALEGFEGSDETINSKGQHFLVSFKQLQSTDWILAANYPIAEAYQPITRLRDYFVPGIIAALLFAIAMSWRLGTGVTRPLTGIIKQFTRLAKPDSDRAQRLDESRTDELGQLAVSFNKLLDEIQQQGQKIQEREYHFRQMFEGHSAIMLMIEPHSGCIVNANSSAAKFYGYSLEQLRSMNISEFTQLPPELLAIELERSVVCTENFYVFPHRLADGSIRTVEVHSTPIGVGDSILLYSIVHDITDRKRAEEGLKESESRMLAITESAQDAIIMMNPSGCISFWNPSAERIFGYASGEAMGKNLHALLAPQRYHDAQDKVFQNFLKTGKGSAVGQTVELEGLHKSGREKSVELSLSAVELPDGWHAIGIMRDITAKKLASEKLASFAEMMEQRNVELSVALKTAEEATQAKSIFLATMSHEIRTPMNGVIGMTGLLLDTELTEEQRGYVEVVNKSGENLLGLINDILDFSKIEAGKLDIEILDFDLRTTMEDTAEMLAIRASQAGLELICRIDPDVPTNLKGDPGRLRQIITNLAGNSIKFTHKGEIVIGARLALESEETVVIRFEITDTGIGIPEDRRAAIFSPFTQVDGSTTRKYGGTGLGLAICKQLTELMGGEIGIESEKGIGSTFWFTVCFGKGNPDIPKTAEVSFLQDITATKVLVVDDNATHRRLMMTLLSLWGCKSETAVDGVSALALMSEAVDAGEPFRVALIDQKMPEMDGLELGRRVKGDPSLESTLLIMVTAHCHPGIATQLKGLGFVGYVPKPVRQTQLHQCIAQALELGDQSRTIPEMAALERPVAEVAARSIRILVAEDNSFNLKVAQGILGKLGYKSDVAANGLEAVQALELIDYDIVLMDCMMPEMDGFEATIKIRNPESKVLNHKVPIIAMTANAMTGDRERCLNAGMDDYLSKPVRKNELAGLLEKWGEKTTMNFEE